MNKSILILLLSCVFGQIIAQGTIPTINRQEQHILKSKITGTSYQLFVSLPMNYSQKGSQHYPVMYLLDGNLAFPTAHATRTGMDLFGGLENIIIVGIGYSWEKSLAPWWTGRWTDLTPTIDVSDDSSNFSLRLLNLPKGALKSGGANEFIHSIKKEIMPFIEKSYKTNGDNGIVGHSLGGLFVGYCLLKETTLFKRYGILSPAFAWDNGNIFDLEKSFSEQNKSMPALVFTSVGSRERDEMVNSMTKFADALKSHNYKGLTLVEQIFENEDHVSVGPASLSRTLKVLYPKK